MIVRFVNIGGIDDHYGLIFLFIIQKAIEGFCGLVIKVIYHLRYNQLVPNMSCFLWECWLPPPLNLVTTIMLNKYRICYMIKIWFLLLHSIHNIYDYIWIKKKIEHALFIINVGYDNKIFYGTFRISIHNDGIPKIILLFWWS